MSLRYKYDEDDHAGDTIDGIFVEPMILKSRGRASACNMCGFQRWEPGDTKYVVEHWTRQETERQIEASDLCSDYVIESNVNWDAPPREHLCPACAVKRGLNYDKYYKQNKNAPEYSRGTKRPNEDDEDKDVKHSKTVSDTANACEIVAKGLAAAKIPSCSLSPHADCPLFVAWNGVLVFVYEGFPQSFLKAKHVIKNSIPNLKPEKFGSKWPKTTLAAVFDDSPDLSLEEMEKLKLICETYSRKIKALEALETGSSIVNIQSLHVVEYECRSLEQLHSRVDVPLVKTGKVHTIPSQEQRENVDTVVKEWEIVSEYLGKVNAPGSRMKSYRLSEEGEEGVGATCVAFLEGCLSRRLRQILVDFRIAIDLEFPGRYAWFAEVSLHCTLMSLDCEKS